MGCSSLCCTNQASGAIFRGCSSLCCTNKANGAFLLCWCTSCSGKRQSRAETSAPPIVPLFF